MMYNVQFREEGEQWRDVGSASRPDIAVKIARSAQRAYAGCEVRIFDEDGVIMEQAKEATV